MIDLQSIEKYVYEHAKTSTNYDTGQVVTSVRFQGKAYDVTYSRSDYAANAKINFSGVVYAALIKKVCDDSVILSTRAKIAKTMRLRQIRCGIWPMKPN